MIYFTLTRYHLKIKDNYEYLIPFQIEIGNFSALCINKIFLYPEVYYIISFPLRTIIMNIIYNKCKLRTIIILLKQTETRVNKLN